MKESRWNSFVVYTIPKLYRSFQSRNIFFLQLQHTQYIQEKLEFSKIQLRKASPRGAVQQWKEKADWKSSLFSVNVTRMLDSWLLLIIMSEQLNILIIGNYPQNFPNDIYQAVNKLHMYKVPKKLGENPSLYSCRKLSKYPRTIEWMHHRRSANT